MIFNGIHKNNTIYVKFVGFQMEKLFDVLEYCCVNIVLYFLFVFFYHILGDFSCWFIGSHLQAAWQKGDETKDEIPFDSLGLCSFILSCEKNRVGKLPLSSWCYISFKLPASTPIWQPSKYNYFHFVIFFPHYCSKAEIYRTQQTLLCSSCT